MYFLTLRKESILLMILVIIRQATRTKSDNQNGNIVRDSIKMERLVRFKIGLNSTLLSMRNSITNITVLEIVDGFLK